MRKRLTSCLIFLALILICISSAVAQQSVVFGTVSTYDGALLSGVNVTANGVASVTDASGYYQLNNVASVGSAVIITFSKSGLRTASFQIALNEVQSRVNYEMIATPPHEYYLAPYGSDRDGDGSFARPWKNFVKADVNVVAGDLVHILPGTFPMYYSGASTLPIVVPTGSTYGIQRSNSMVTAWVAEDPLKSNISVGSMVKVNNVVDTNFNGAYSVAAVTKSGDFWAIGWSQAGFGGAGSGGGDISGASPDIAWGALIHGGSTAGRVYYVADSYLNSPANDPVRNSFLIGSGSAETVLSIKADYIGVVGLDVTFPSKHWGLTGTASAGVHYTLYHGNFVHDIGTTVACGGGGAGIQDDWGYYKSSYTTITGNKLYNIGPMSCSSHVVHPIYVSSEHAFVANNTVVNTNGWGVHLWHCPRYNTVVHNVVMGASGAGAYTSGSDYTDNTHCPLQTAGDKVVDSNLFYNNIASGNRMAFAPQGAGTRSGNLWKNNISYNNTFTYSSPFADVVTGTSTANPLLDGRFVPSGTSIAIAGGVDIAPSTLLTDYWGSVRTSPLDIGAANHEIGPTAPITPPPAVCVITGLIISPSSLTMIVGDTGQLRLTYQCQGGTTEPLAAADSVAWASTSNAIATVSSAGLVTAIGSGSATVSATVTPTGVSTEYTASIVAAVSAVTPPDDNTRRLFITVIDSINDVFNNGTWRVEHLPPFNRPGDSVLSSNGQRFTAVQSGAIDVNGQFYVTLTRNDKITPSLSKWRFTFCPKAEVGDCFVTDYVVDSTTPSSLTFKWEKPIRVFSTTLAPRAYFDYEMYPPRTGGLFYDTTTDCLKVQSNSLAWYTLGCKGSGGSTSTTSGTCPAGTSVTGVNTDGSLICGAPPSSGTACPSGQVLQGIDTAGKPICTANTDPLVCPSGLVLSPADSSNPFYQTIGDAFDRPDGILSGQGAWLSPEGAYWTNSATIVSNVIKSTNHSGAVWNLPIAANQYATVEHTNVELNLTGPVGTIIRSNTAGTSFYFAGIDQPGRTLKLGKVISGVKTVLWSTPDGCISTNPGTIGLFANGSTIGAICNGTILHTVTDTDLTGGLVGMLLYVEAYSTPFDTVDNFKAGLYINNAAFVCKLP